MKAGWKTRLGWALAGYVAASLAGYALAAIAATQFVLAQVTGMGLPVSLVTRLQTTAQDLAGMAGLYLPLLAAGFLIAFLVTALVSRWVHGRRTALYTLAGAVSVVAVHVIMKAVFEITLIAGARSTWGLAAQCVAGATAGYIFAIVSLPPASKQTS